MSKRTEAIRMKFNAKMNVIEEMEHEVERLVEELNKPLTRYEVVWTNPEPMKDENGNVLYRYGYHWEKLTYEAWKEKAGDRFDESRLEEAHETKYDDVVYSWDEATESELLVHEEIGVKIAFFQKVIEDITKKL